MATPELFPFVDYWWFYLAFTGFIAILLLVDLGVFHRTPHAIKTREALAWSIGWVVLSLTFNYLFYCYLLHHFSTNPDLAKQFGGEPQQLASRYALEFLTGYLIEQALSVDNIFVFVVVFRYFAIPAQYQHRILFYGIIGALFFRGIFIALGSLLMQFHIVEMAFGAFLMFTGFRLFVAPEAEIDPAKNPALKILKRFLPVTTHFDGPRFFTRVNHVRHATPLLVTLVVVELTDIVFAVDSVPAIFAITKEPLIVFASNVLAILGLRSLYFLLAHAMERFHYLKIGLGFVLVFVGVKMLILDELWGGRFPIVASLLTIATVLVASIAVSFLIPPKTETVD